MGCAAEARLSLVSLPTRATAPRWGPPASPPPHQRRRQSPGRVCFPCASRLQIAAHNDPAMRVRASGHSCRHKPATAHGADQSLSDRGNPPLTRQFHQELPTPKHRCEKNRHIRPQGSTSEHFYHISQKIRATSSDDKKSHFHTASAEFRTLEMLSKGLRLCERQNSVWKSVRGVRNHTDLN
jgi:hypothetical protein